LAATIDANKMYGAFGEVAEDGPQNECSVPNIEWPDFMADILYAETRVYADDSGLNGSHVMVTFA
jgi:hypothetical protein